jgi:hypothetical protein
MGFFSDLFGGDEPDYDSIAAANSEASQYAKQIADRDYAFRMQVYNEQKPRMEYLQDLAAQVSQEQLGQMQDANTRADSQWDYYTQTFRPIEERMAQEAMEYGGEADQQRAAGRAVSDVRQQGAIAQGATNRGLASMGVNPNSGKALSVNMGNGLRQTAMAAGAATNAREGAKDKGISLRAGAASFGRNMTNTAGQQVGLSTNAGNSAVGNAGTGANAYIPGAQFATGGAGLGMQAAGLQQSGALGLGQLQASTFANKDNFLGGLMGAGTSLGAAYIGGGYL